MTSNQPGGSSILSRGAKIFLKLYMKLSELFEDLALPFDMEDELPDFKNPEYSKSVGTMNGNIIWGSRYYGSNFDAYGILDDDKNPLAVLIIQTHQRLYTGKKCQQIEKVWVDSNHRNKAYATSLIGFVIRKLKTPLISNRLLTDDGIKLYKSYLKNKTFDISVYDFKNKKLIDEPTDLFSLPNSYQFILEKEMLAHQDDRLFEEEFGELKIYSGEFD